MTPDGFKPIRHRKCGSPVGYIREEVTIGSRARAADVRKLDGTQPLPLEIVQWHCPTCDVTFTGLKRVTIE